MSVATDKVIITAEVAGRKIVLGTIEVTLDARMEESINQRIAKK